MLQMALVEGSGGAAAAPLHVSTGSTAAHGSKVLPVPTPSPKSSSAKVEPFSYL
jgi:hypothetical protein